MHGQQNIKICFISFGSF